MDLKDTRKYATEKLSKLNDSISKFIPADPKAYALIGAGLVSGVLGGAYNANSVNAQERDDRNWIYSSNPEQSVAGDGILLKRFVYDFNLVDKDSINLSEELELYAREGDLSYRALNMGETFENVIESFKNYSENNPNSKQRAFMNYVKGLPENLSVADSASVSSLEKALEDGVITSEEMKESKEGLYAILAESEDIDSSGLNRESIPVLVYLTNRDEEEKEDPKDEERYIAREDEERKPSTRFGLQMGAGTNGEASIGGFLQADMAPWMNVEAFANSYLISGNPVFENTETEVNSRSKQLIGPDTYKQRTDEITTISEGNVVAEVGLGIAPRLGDFEFPLKASKVFTNTNITKQGKSTITHERNGEFLRDPQTITGELEKRDSRLEDVLSVGAGVRYNFNGNWSAEASYNKIGKNNIGKISIRRRF